MENREDQGARSGKRGVKGRGREKGRGKRDGLERKFNGGATFFS